MPALHKRYSPCYVRMYQNGTKEAPIANTFTISSIFRSRRYDQPSLNISKLLVRVKSRRTHLRRTRNTRGWNGGPELHSPSFPVVVYQELVSLQATRSGAKSGTRSALTLSPSFGIGSVADPISPSQKSSAAAIIPRPSLLLLRPKSAPLCSKTQFFGSTPPEKQTHDDVRGRRAFPPLRPEKCMKGEWGEVQFSAAPTLGLLASTVTLSASAVAAPRRLMWLPKPSPPPSVLFLPPPPFC